MKKILGISAFYHDSAACLIVDNKIIAAAQEERFNRIKSSKDFPINSIKYCIQEAGIEIKDLDAIVYYEKPLLKLERILKTFYNYAPFGLATFIQAGKSIIFEKFFIKRRILSELSKIGELAKEKTKFLYSEHHLSHAASCFFTSPFESAAILTIDGVGEWSTATISKGDHNRIKIVKELWYPHSVGLFYSSFTYFLGFEINNGEYKLMGLAPYGNEHSDQTKFYRDSICKKLIRISDDGSIFLNQDFFKYSFGLKMIPTGKWENLFGFPRRSSYSEIKQEHCDLAFVVQSIIEEIIIKMAREAKRLTKSKNLCLAGGVALNCVAVGKLLNESIFENIYVQPGSGDAGGAVGAALAINYMYYEGNRRNLSSKDLMRGSFLGPKFHNFEIKQLNKGIRTKYKYYQNFDKLVEVVAKKIAEGNIIGWFQGRMEFGPRALGNRSILADPRLPNVQNKINKNIKNRENFRPFAPSILYEDLLKYYETNRNFPYMSAISYLKKERRNILPQNFSSLSLNDKLNFLNCEIPAVVHVDFSSRLQTVSNDVNPKFWKLLMAFKNETQCSVLLNTSFNLSEEPIVCTPLDAYQCFIKSNLDYLVLNNFLYSKQDYLRI